MVCGQVTRRTTNGLALGRGDATAPTRVRHIELGARRLDRVDRQVRLDGHGTHSGACRHDCDRPWPRREASSKSVPRKSRFQINGLVGVGCRKGDRCVPMSRAAKDLRHSYVLCMRSPTGLFKHLHTPQTMNFEGYTSFTHPSLLPKGCAP